MHTTSASAVALAEAIVKGLGTEDRVTVAVFPPFPYLTLVGGVLRGSPIALGAQNMYGEKEGAFTGEVSPTMLVDVGCRYVVLGHSERRHKLGETDALINQKVRLAMTMGLRPILCVGETLEERDHNQTETVLERQLRHGLAQIQQDDTRKLVLAYEPVWAIGTGRNATPDQAEQACAFIRRIVADVFGENHAQEIPIQYGGSVKPENARSLMSQPDVDGALVGGACLIAEQFLAIIRAALPV